VSFASWAAKDIRRFPDARSAASIEARARTLVLALASEVDVSAGGSTSISSPASIFTR